MGGNAFLGLDGYCLVQQKTREFFSDLIVKNLKLHRFGQALIL